MREKKQDTNSTRETIFEFLVQYKREHDGNTPSTREIAEACCLSISGVNYHLFRLEVGDRIRISEDGRRNIEVTGGAWIMPYSDVAPGESQAAPPDSDDPARQHKSSQTRKSG